MLAAAAPLTTAPAPCMPCSPLACRAGADFKQLLDGYTYGWPPTEKFTYTLDGTQVGAALQQQQRSTHAAWQPAPGGQGLAGRPAPSGGGGGGGQAPAALPPPRPPTSAPLPPPTPVEQVFKERIELHTRPGTLPGCALEHIVQPGDFCYVIADTFGISLETLMVFNPTLNCTEIQPGAARAGPLAARAPAPRATAPAAPLASAARSPCAPGSRSLNRCPPARLCSPPAEDLVCLQPGDPEHKKLETMEEVAPANATAAAAARPAAPTPKPAAAPQPTPKPAPKPAQTDSDVAGARCAPVPGMHGGSMLAAVPLHCFRSAQHLLPRAAFHGTLCHALLPTLMPPPLLPQRHRQGRACHHHHHHHRHSH